MRSNSIFRLSPAAFLCSAAVLVALPTMGVQVFHRRALPAAQAATAKFSPTTPFLLFRTASSSMEQSFVASLPLAQVRVISVCDLNAPEALQYQVKGTPTLIRINAQGEAEGRWTESGAITAALRKSKPAPAQTCSVKRVPRLRWVEENDRRAAWVYRRFNAGRDGVPDIFKTMSLRPELMERVLEISEKGHFSDGYLDCLTKERLATLVSSLNRSDYCLGSHAAGMADLGAKPAEIATLASGRTDSANLSAKQKALLDFARRLTRDPGRHIAQDIQRLRECGWRDEQIFEAAFDVSLFNFFNRMAAAYDLEAPQDGLDPALFTQPRAARLLSSTR